MEYVTLDVEAIHLLVAYLDRLFIVPCVYLTSDCQPCVCGGGTNEFYYRHTACQGLPAPILANVTEHLMFDLIPLRRAWWVMAYSDRKPRFIGKCL